MGKGVSKAVENINKVIAPAVVVSPSITVCKMHWGSTCKCKASMSSRQGLNPVNQKEVDQKMFELDGTDNKGKLGANAILAVSMATSKVLCPVNAFLHWSFPHVQYVISYQQ